MGPYVFFIFFFRDFEMSHDVFCVGYVPAFLKIMPVGIFQIFSNLTALLLHACGMHRPRDVPFELVSSGNTRCSVEMAKKPSHLAT